MALKSSLVIHSIALAVGQHTFMVLGHFPFAPLTTQVAQQVRERRNRTDLQTQLIAHILHGAVFNILAILRGFLLALN